jgi:hypothetical protein
MKRRAFLLGAVALAPILAIIAKFPYREKLFAVVYATDTKDIRRLYDTSDDIDDSHLMKARAVLASDETMEAFKVKDFPSRWPRDVASHIGRGVIL